MIEHLWRIEIMLAILCGATLAIAIIQVVKFVLVLAPKSKIVNVWPPISKSMGPVPLHVVKALSKLASRAARER